MVVRLTVLRANGLKDMDAVGKQDPYCRVTLGKETHQTKVVNEGGANPVWEPGTADLAFKWQGEDYGGERLRIEILDQDLFTSDFVGECWISLAALARAGGFDGALQVYRRGTKPRGTLTVKVECEDVRPPDDPDSAWDRIEVTPAKVHKNIFAGVVQHIEEGVVSMPSDVGFLTYQVALSKIAETFGDVWHHGKDGIHPDTFTDDAMGKAKRAALSAAHLNLYFDEMVPGGPLNMRTTVRFISSGPSFRAMLHGGLQGGRRRVYTYSVTDDGLFFSETGAALSKDNLSKHAMHANGAMAVRYAGTFRFCERDDASGVVPVLVIDNDSGTYAPKGSNGPVLQALLEASFPGLEVLVLDVMEAQPEHTKVWRGPNETKGEKDAVYPGKWAWQLA